MIPSVYFQSEDPGACEAVGARASPVPCLSGATGGTIGPIFAQVLPPSALRSIHAAQERYASIDVPLMIVPSFSTRGLARIGPSRPAGRCSAGLQVLPSLVWNSTGFQQGTSASRASSTRALHPARVLVAPQINTSGLPSAVPPN